jgi:hypothetical protein
LRSCSAVLTLIVDSSETRIYSDEDRCGTKPSRRNGTWSCE